MDAILHFLVQIIANSWIASVTQFTNLTLSKCLECSKEWIKIEFKSQCVAERFQSCENQLEENESLDLSLNSN